MDQQIQMSDIHTRLQETQTVNKQILKTLTQLSQFGGPCTCNCHREIEEATSEIGKLKRQIDVLDEKKVQQESRHDDFKHQIEDVHKRLEDMQDTLLAAQTDDSKLIKQAQEHLADIHTSQGIVEPLHSEDSNKVTENSFQSSSEKVEDINRTDTDTVKVGTHSEIKTVSTHMDENQYKKGAKRGNVNSLTEATDLDTENDGVESGEAIVRKQTEEADSQTRKSTETAVRKLPVMTDTHKEYKPNFTTASKSSTEAGSKKTDLPKNTPSADTQTRKTSTNMDQTKVEVIHQSSKGYVRLEEDDWRTVAQKILDIEKERAPKEGVFTVICLDISESMSEGDAWAQAKRFVTEFLDGLDEMKNKYGHQGLKEEYVSLVTFGHETKVQAIHVTQYDSIRNKIDCMKLGGPTPLNGGLYIGLAAAMSPKKESLTVNGITINPRFLVITDGCITDLTITAGPDVADPSEIENTKLRLLQQVETITTARAMDMYCVPVGKFDTEFLPLVAGVCESNLLDYQAGRRTARRQYLCTKTVVNPLDPLGLFTGASVTMGDTRGLTKEDQDDIEEIRKGSHKSILKAISSRQSRQYKMYAESSNDKLPVIGTRVRRGPDWKWKNQDSDGPGTVIGHTDDDQQVWVEWDTNTNSSHQNVYRYGFMGYDVLPVDEPRTLKVGQKIAVGCMVRPGKDGITTGMKVWDTGVVIKLLNGSSRDENKAQVRWENGKRGDYSYGEDGRFEIELWTQSGATLSGSGATLSGTVNTNVPPQKQPEHPKKKNKNS